MSRSVASAPLSISGTPVTTATEDSAYAGFTVTASGGTQPYTYSLVGTWPTGISINSSTGAVVGTPTEGGTFANLSVRVTDNMGATADLPAFALAVAVSDPHFANVVLLLGFEGADASTTITDESPAAHGTATVVGNAQIDTAVALAGTSSLLCDGAGDGIVYPDSSDWRLSAANSDQFTIEAFVQTATSTPTNRVIITQAAGLGGLSFYFWCNTTGNGELAFWAGTGVNSFDIQVNSSGLTWATGTRYHVAVDKDATGKIRVYRTGVMVASATPTNSAFADAPARLGIGTDDLGSRFWNGWIDEVRITKGVARYASDAGFTSPTAAFPRS